MDQPIYAASAESWQAELDELAERQRIARRMGGAERIARQHEADRLTVRERIDLCLDAGSFQETGSIAGKATYDESGTVMTDFMPANGVFGRGTIDGRPVVIYGDDFTVRGGSADASIRGKYFMPEQMAGEYRMPLIRMIEGSGGGGSVKTIETRGHANLPGGIDQSSGLWLCAQNMGRVPVVALGLGSVAGLGAARLAASHYSIMVKERSAVFVAGPPVVERLGEKRSKQALGGHHVQVTAGTPREHARPSATAS
jgi:acetyl-CoA carboxylase carboxyltransferase component